MTHSSQPDAELAAQPAAYWTRLAYESVIAFTRREQEKRGFTQLEFWILRHLSPADLATSTKELTGGELRVAMREYLRAEDDVDSTSASLVQRGLLETDSSGRYRITPDGETARLEMAQQTPQIRALIHEGIDDADYVIAVKVLKQLVANTATD